MLEGFKFSFFSLQFKYADEVCLPKSSYLTWAPAETHYLGSFLP